MYHKMKNTLAGLSMAAAFLVGGLFFSEPVPGTELSQPAPAAAPEFHDAALTLALVQAAVSVAQAELAREAAAATADADERSPVLEGVARGRSRLRAQFGMPYYSFGGARARRGESGA